MNSTDLDNNDLLVERFLERDNTFSLFLRGLEIDSAEVKIFSEAIFWVLEAWVINKYEYWLIQKYMWNENFSKKFSKLMREHAWELESEWFSQESLQKISQWISYHVDMILDKFDIYNHVWNWNEEFYKHYAILAQSSHGDIIVSRDFSKVYLFTENCFFNCDWVVSNQEGIIQHFLWYFEDHTIHVNIQAWKVTRFEWKAVWLMERWDINALHMHQWDDEILVVLEDDLIARKSKKHLEDWKTQFLDIMKIWPQQDNVIVTTIDIEVSVVWSRIPWQKDDELDDDTIDARSHILHKLYSLSDDEEIFSTRGKIKDVIVTSDETYVIHETKEYNPNKRSSGYSSKVLWVYAVWEYNDIISWIPEEDEINFIPTHDNLIIINNKAKNKWIYSSRDRSIVEYISLWKISHFTLNGESHINIEFIDSDGVWCFDSRDKLQHSKEHELIIDRNYN